MTARGRRKQPSIRPLWVVVLLVLAVAAVALAIRFGRPAAQSKPTPELSKIQKEFGEFIQRSGGPGPQMRRMGQARGGQRGRQPAQARPGRSP